MKETKIVMSPMILYQFKLQSTEDITFFSIQRLAFIWIFNLIHSYTLLLHAFFLLVLMVVKERLDETPRDALRVSQEKKGRDTIIIKISKEEPYSRHQETIGASKLLQQMLFFHGREILESHGELGT